MDDSEFVLKKLCCTCLSRDRKLSQLCRLKEGINNLYLLLSYDSEAYREGFYKDTASWYICWECWATMCKISKFRSQACLAQKLLSDIVDGRGVFKHLNACLSQLKATLKTSIDLEIGQTHSGENFIDCGPLVKTESDEDLPLSLLHDSTFEGVYTDEESSPTKSLCRKTSNTLKKKKKGQSSSKNGHNADNNKDYFQTIVMNEEEMLESRENRKVDVLYADAPFKCESCILGLKGKSLLDQHENFVHGKNVLEETMEYVTCDVCLGGVQKEVFKDHRHEHYLKFKCHSCDYLCFTKAEVEKHSCGEKVRNSQVPIERKKVRKKPPGVKKPGSKPRNSKPMLDKRTPFGYSCPDCKKYFDNKGQRWKHIQKCHREGYKCGTCGKRFPLKHNMLRHEQMHQDPPPRVECAVCRKMVRVDLQKAHAKIHTERDRYRCAECDKCFVSQASYENHLKYTQAHAAFDVLKYKCSLCDKGYRSRAELRDHVNYQHMDKTQHKCPICGKALSTRRCVNRHVKRAHEGVKENARDKICQQCGKAFRDKKCLREHEFIHTGERPLSCEICGCTFRQSASLYTHKRRVHKVFPSKKTVTHVEGGET